MQDFPDGYLYPISNYMYEDVENEKKRRINILKPEVVSTIDTNFSLMITQ
jgi:hypothetical protein